MTLKSKIFRVIFVFYVNTKNPDCRKMSKNSVENAMFWGDDLCKMNGIFIFTSKLLFYLTSR